MRLKLAVVLLSSIALSCQKKVLKPNVFSPRVITDGVVWKTPIDSAHGGAECRTPVIWEDKVLWSSAASGEGFKIRLSECLNGSLIWTWDDFIKYADLPYANYDAVGENCYVLNSFQETHVIDLNSGLTRWQSYNPNTGPYISLVGGFLYGKLHNRDFQPEVCELRRSSVKIQDWRPVLSLDAQKDSGYAPAIFGPSLWMHPGGDSILIFQNRSWNFKTNDGKIDLHAYNLTQASNYYCFTDIEPSGNSNVYPPLIDGDRAYLLGQKNLHCIDLKSQSIKWQKGFPGTGHHLLLSSPIISRTRMIIKSDDDRIYAFNKFDGNLIWSTSNAGHSPSHLCLHEGVVYYTSEADGKLYGVRISDGAVVLEMSSPHQGDERYPKASFDSGLAINSEYNLLYIQDRYFMMAIKIPKLD